jgi:hypothetical protein
MERDRDHLWRRLEIIMQEVLPAYWDDNAITLLPGEIRKLNVKYERQKDR